mmetsp:Transcript_15824/g.64680  ORF Transcript_15824/g.64680 Transcript_15824/m.64680 type:complete len:147 (-) Transcript_15824:3751-4191(-)
MSKVNLQRLGETVFQSSDRVSAELLALTYGSTVKQLLVDYEEPDEVNKQLDQMGYNIGKEMGYVGSLSCASALEELIIFTSWTLFKESASSRMSLQIRKSIRFLHLWSLRRSSQRLHSKCTWALLRTQLTGIQIRRSLACSSMKIR